LLLVSRAAASAPSGKTLPTPERHCFGKPYPLVATTSSSPSVVFISTPEFNLLPHQSRQNLTDVRSRQRNSPLQHHQIFSALALLRIKIAMSTAQIFSIRIPPENLSTFVHSASAYPTFLRARVGNKFAIVNFPHSITLPVALRGTW
jgi:hypothetical protein